MNGQVDSEETSKGVETRRRIVEHAFMRATTIGLEGLSIGTLAKELEISKSGLFGHFRSKEKLQLEVLGAAAEHFKGRVFLPALRVARGEARLMALFDGWLSWVHDDKLPGGCVFLGAASEWDDREGIVRDEIVTWFHALRAGLIRAAALAVETGDFRRELDCELFAYEMQGIVLRFHLESRLLRNRSAEALARRAFERLVESAREPQGLGIHSAASASKK